MSAPWEKPGAFDALTPAQENTLGLIYIGRDGGHAPSVLRALLDAGWIVEREDQIRGTGKTAIDRIPITVKRYEPPSIAAHMAWCAWCAAQPDDDEGGSR